MDPLADLPSPGEEFNIQLQELMKHSDMTNEEQKKIVTALLEGNQDIFTKQLRRPGTAKLTPFSVDVQGHNAVRKRAYRTSQSEKKVIKEEIDKMLKAGVIKPYTSAWTAPVVLVTKKDGCIRFCTDYRGLNAVTKKDSHPLPRVKDIFDQLGKAKYFSTMDMTTGFWQNPVDEKSQELLAFISDFGIYTYNVMPYGVKNGPPVFQRNMEVLLSGLTWLCCLVYVDDIVVYSETFEQHIKDLQLVFDRIKKADMFLKLSKCKFVRQELPFLGHIVSKDGVKPDASKISAVANWPVPTKVKQVQQFLGLAGYYRSFVYNFANIAIPLYKLVAKDVKWNWTEECSKSFEHLKKSLCSAPLLIFPDFNKEFVVSTDASDIALGGILSQIDCNGKERVVAYYSRTFKDAELNYHTTEKECLAVISCVREWRSYIYGSSFKVITDHSALKWLMNMKDGTPRLLRWAMALQEYDMEIHHKPGKLHSNVDCLSRPPIAEYICTISDENSNNKDILKDVGQSQRKDNYLKGIIDYIEKGVLPTNKVEAANIVHKSNGMEIIKGKLYLKIKEDGDIHWKLVVPENLTYELFEDNHNGLLGGHRSDKSTYQRMELKYWWRGMYRDIEKWTSQCDICQERKHPTHPIRMEMKSIAISRPMEMIGMDITGPLPVTERGYKYLLTYVDYFTKWAGATPLKEITAEAVASAFYNNIITIHGAPEKLMSDRGAQFMSQVIQDVNRLHNIKKVSTTAYHPQTDGLTEKWNASLLNMLSCYCSENQSDWDLYVCTAVMAYNMTPHSTTKYTPFFMMHGREARSPFEVSHELFYPDERYQVEEFKTELSKRLLKAYKSAASNIQKAQLSQSNQYNKKVNNIQLKVGDKVLLFTPTLGEGRTRKLARHFTGPYTITQLLSSENVQIKSDSNENDVQRVHINRLKVYKGESQQLDPEHYEIQSIIRQRKVKGKIQYLIKWKGWTNKYNSWILAQDLNAPEILQQFHRRQKQSTTPDTPNKANSKQTVGSSKHTSSVKGIQPATVSPAATTVTRSGRQVVVPQRSL